MTFLNTYKNNENSLAEGIKLLGDEISILEKSKAISEDDLSTVLSTNKVVYDKTVLEAEKALFALDIARKNAVLSLENAKKIRDVTIRRLNNAIKISENTRNLTSKEYKKLFITAPINGTVTDIFVDVGQDVQL
jgi:biotin carboxyl carrier protein